MCTRKWVPVPALEGDSSYGLSTIVRCSRCKNASGKLYCVHAEKDEGEAYCFKCGRDVNLVYFCIKCKHVDVDENPD